MLLTEPGVYPIGWSCIVLLTAGTVKLFEKTCGEMIAATRMGTFGIPYEQWSPFPKHTPVEMVFGATGTEYNFSVVKLHVGNLETQEGLL